MKRRLDEMSVQFKLANMASQRLKATMKANMLVRTGAFALGLNTLSVIYIRLAHWAPMVESIALLGSL